MVSLKYDFDDFRSKHWLYTFDISVDIPVISHVESKLKIQMIKLLGVVKLIIRDSKDSTPKYLKTRAMVIELITPKDS